MDLLKRVAAVLDGEAASDKPRAPLTLEQKRLHVLLVLLRKHAVSVKKQSGRSLTLKAVERIIHLLRENLHYFEKMRLQMVKSSYEERKVPAARR